MDQFAQPWEYTLWEINFLLEWALVLITLRREHQRAFPAFFSFVVFSAVKTTILFPISLLCSLRTYFVAYWLGQLLALAFLFCVVHEVFDAVTKRATWMSPTMRRALIRLATATVVVAIGISLQFKEASPFSLMNYLVSLQRSLSFAIFGFMFVLVSFTRSYRVPWGRRETGIALGVIVAFVFQTLWPKVSDFIIGSRNFDIYRQMVPVFYSAALLVWIRSFLQIAPRREAIEFPLSRWRFKIVKGQKTGTRMTGNQRLIA